MNSLRSRSAMAVALVAWLVPVGVAAQKTPVGLEFQVNAVTTGSQRLASVAADADGDFVVAWDIFDQDGYNYGVFARRFSSSGAPLGGEFQVNTYTTEQQLNPVAAINASGDFIIAWFSTGQGGTGQDGAGGGIFARRFSSAGAAVGGEFQINSFTADYQRNPTVALASSGAFLIAWQSNLQDGESWGVFARRFSSAGAALAAEFQVNGKTTLYQGNPSSVVAPNGDIAVVWESNGQDGSAYGIFGRRFSSAGAFLATEFRVNGSTTGSERFPAAAADAAGNFLVIWQDYSIKEIFGRRFSSTGAPLTNQFQVNTYTTSYQQRPAAAAASDGDFVVVWESTGQDGSGEGIFGQRFAAITTLDVDGNGGLNALTDGLLVLRFLFGFSGDTLAGGAIGGGCTRCDGPAVTSYLTGLGNLLDIDGNASKAPLTDGLLVLRYIFGFRGGTLIGGAVDTGGCSRCDAPAIEGWLAGLTS